MAYTYLPSLEEAIHKAEEYSPAGYILQPASATYVRMALHGGYISIPVSQVGLKVSASQVKLKV